MKSTVVFIYRLTSDNGLAPCVMDGLITLVCCKGGKAGLRHYIGSRFNTEYKDTDVWVIGICGKAMSKGNLLVYIGKVQETIPMSEYSKRHPERKDAVYDETGRISNKEPVIHNTAAERNTDQMGKYALLFDKKNSMYFIDYIPIPLNRDEISQDKQGHRRCVINNENDPLYQLINQLNKEWFGKPIPDHPEAKKHSCHNKKCIC